MIAVGLSSLCQVFGLGIDIESLGQSLNGWSAKRTASYTIDSQNYRTHVPTVTENLDGGIFISMRVEHVSALRPDAVAYLELTFAPNGYVGASQIRLTVNGQTYNTGQVLRPEEALSIGDDIGSPDWRSAHTKLVLELFNKLDAEFAKDKGEEKKPKRDLWGRFKGSKVDQADISAALRHNLNLLLSNVGFHFGGK